MSKGAEVFLLRIRNILFDPRNEWRVIKEEQATYWNILFGYTAVIAAIPPVSALLERVISNAGLVNNAVYSPMRYVFIANVAWYFVIIVNVMITAAVVTAVAVKNEPGWIGLRGLKLTIYSFTPSFLVSILVIIPRLGWIVYFAISYSVYLLYLGIKAMLGVESRKAASYTIVSFLAAALIVGTLNMFEYMLESFIASKVFF